LGEPVRADQAPPREALGDLEQATTNLRTALPNLASAACERDKAYAAKVYHLKEHNQLYVYTAHSFEAHCRLAEEPALAERVRRSRHWGTQEANEEPSPEAPEGPLEEEEPTPQVPPGDMPAPGQGNPQIN
jgi:hypothetical protein